MNARHGTTTMYSKHGCRCAPCRYAASTARRSANPYADPTPVTKHVVELIAAGIGPYRIAELAGVSRAAVYHAAAGPRRITARVAAALLAVPADVAAPQKWLDPTGTTRRLRALTAIGWMNLEVAEATGVDLSYLAQMTHGRRRLTPVMVRSVRRAYDQMSMRVPADSYGSNRARLRAWDRRWFPPLAWDDEAIDDPAALPCLLPPVEPVDRELELLVQHVVAGHPVEVTRPARVEIVRRLPDAPRAELAELARCAPDYINRLKREEALC